MKHHRVIFKSAQRAGELLSKDPNKIHLDTRSEKAKRLIDEATKKDFEKVKYKDFSSARLITLHNDTAMNATTMGMMNLLREYLFIQHHATDVSHNYENPNSTNGSIYITTGTGNKSYSAGGDIVTLIKSKNAGEQFGGYIIYLVAYHMWLQSHGVQGGWKQPSKTLRNAYVALWNGYVMGGGVGLSLHGQYRVACPQTVFAMPETSIGFFPDVGAGYFLPRLDRPSEYHRGDGVPGLGLYLGLLGARVKGADLIHAGLATHFVPDLDAMRQLQEALCQAGPAEVEAILETHSVARKDLPPFTLAPVAPMLQRVFSLSPETTVEKVVTALEEEAKNASQPKEVKELAQNTLKLLPAVKCDHNDTPWPMLCPSSLKIALLACQQGMISDSPLGTLERDAVGIVNRSLGHDFREGVDALFIRKDKQPRWKAKSLSEVDMEEVINYGTPLNASQPTLDPFYPHF